MVIAALVSADEGARQWLRLDSANEQLLADDDRGLTPSTGSPRGAGYSGLRKGDSDIRVEPSVENHRVFVLASAACQKKPLPIACRRC